MKSFCTFDILLGKCNVYYRYYITILFYTVQNDDLLGSPLGEAMYRAIDPHLDHTECNAWLR